VVRRHVLRNALISPMSLWGLDFSHAFGGFVLYVEVIFGIPGIGRLTAETLESYDLTADRRPGRLARDRRRPVQRDRRPDHRLAGSAYAAAGGYVVRRL
jgi:hypothetical protein